MTDRNTGQCDTRARQSDLANARVELKQSYVNVLHMFRWNVSRGTAHGGMWRPSDEWRLRWRREALLGAVAATTCSHLKQARGDAKARLSCLSRGSLWMAWCLVRHQLDKHDNRAELGRRDRHQNPIQVFKGSCEEHVSSQKLQYSHQSQPAVALRSRNVPFRGPPGHCGMEARRPGRTQGLDQRLRRRRRVKAAATENYSTTAAAVPSLHLLWQTEESCRPRALQP